MSSPTEYIPPTPWPRDQEASDPVSMEEQAKLWASRHVENTRAQLELYKTEANRLTEVLQDYQKAIDILENLLLGVDVD